MTSKRQIQAQLTRSSHAARALPHYPRHGQSWTVTEDRLLIRLFGKRLAPRSAYDESDCYGIAERIGRTPMAVLKRIQTLRLAARYGGKP